MLTYNQAIWKLASIKAKNLLDGAMISRAEGAETVAWIYDVTIDKINEDIELVFDEACKELRY